MILGHLSNTQLCRSMRVSKAWNHACRNKSLWKDLRFMKYWSASKPRPFRRGVLNDIISNRASNLATSLTISGMGDFGVDAIKLGLILKALPKLEFLSLKSSGSGADAKAPTLKEALHALLQNAPPSLTSLHFGPFVESVGSGWTFPPAAQLAQTLRELVIFEPYVPVALLGPSGLIASEVWPRLEKFSVSGDKYPAPSPYIDFVNPPLPRGYWSHANSLQTVYIDSCHACVEVCEPPELCYRKLP